MSGRTWACAFRLLLVSTACACAATGAKVYEETTADPVFSASAALAVESIRDDGQRESMKETLENIRASWGHRPAYAQVRAQVSKIQSGTDDIRLEFGSANGGTYHVYWYFRSSTGPLLVYQARERDPIRMEQISEEEWQALHDVTKGFRDAGCRSDFGVSDGYGLYLVSHSGGISKSSVAYGLFPSRADEYSPDCKNLLRSLLHIPQQQQLPQSTPSS
jgi:hypothetical protein